MDKTRPVCADFFCKQLAAGGNGKDRALSCVCPTCAQDGAANFDLLGTILSEVQSVCSPSQLSRVEQAQFALGTIVRPHYETGEFQRHLLRKCDGSSHCLIHLNSDPSHSVGKGAEKEYPFRQLCYDAAGNVVRHETFCVPCLELDRLAYECEQIILELPIACSGVSSGATVASSGTGNGSAVVSSGANPTADSSCSGNATLARKEQLLEMVRFIFSADGIFRWLGHLVRTTSKAMDWSEILSNLGPRSCAKLKDYSSKFLPRHAVEQHVCDHMCFVQCFFSFHVLYFLF